MGVRRRSRESALKMLYACELSKQPVEDVIILFWQQFEAADDSREFADRLVRGTVGNLEALDRSIGEVSIHWKISRMACVDRNILRMAAYELFHVDEVPKRVTLNEAIEIAKRYGAEDSWAFINGILDKLAGEVD